MSVSLAYVFCRPWLSTPVFAERCSQVRPWVSVDHIGGSGKVLWQLAQRESGVVEGSGLCQMSHTVDAGHWLSIAGVFPPLLRVFEGWLFSGGQVAG